MDWVDAVSLTVVLLLALYGCAQLMYQMACMLLRPREPCVKLLLTAKGDAQDIEQHIRYAQTLAKQLSLPLVVRDEGLCGEAKMVAQALVCEGVGEFHTDQESEMSCIDDTTCV